MKLLFNLAILNLLFSLSGLWLAKAYYWWVKARNERPGWVSH